jgi:hypothetical protein
MGAPQFTLTADEITESEARLLEAYGPLQMARLIEELAQTLSVSPAYAADTTFAVIWQWLARKDAILDRIKSDLALARGDTPADPQVEP